MKVRPTMRWLRLAVAATGMALATTASAQTDDVETLKQQVIKLYQAAKYADGVPIAELYAEAVKARYGAEHYEYAMALSSLAALYDWRER